METNLNTIVIPDPYAHAIDRSGDEIWCKKAQELARLKQNIKQLEAMAVLVTNQLKELSCNVDSKGNGFIFAVSYRKGNVQYKDIPQLKDVNLEQFRGQPIEVWKLDVVIQ